MSYLLGVDIGGTFTDFVLCHAPTGRVWLGKRLTTAEEPARAVREGLADLLAQAGAAGADLEVVIHGTTLITNALIERKGARTALLATDGYRDLLEIGTELRYDPYDLFLEVPEPLVPRALRFDVPERLDAAGRVRMPLDAGAVAKIAGALREAGVEAVGVCFLHAFLEPAHERQARDVLARECPGLAVSLSHEVAPEIREYPRMSTTVANAYVQPLAARYLARLHADLAAAGYRRPLYMMLSSGGVVTHEAAARFPIRLVESGPAAGALATATLGRRLGRRNLLSFDMGGTTAKACLIDDGAPTMTREFEVARVKRFARGSGLPLQVPVIEMIEIGAGGGSLARVDGMGLLKVGPESAGSAPGPACYGRGGTRPTVTDADLVLGYLDPGSFLGGRMRLDAEAARAALGGPGRRPRPRRGAGGPRRLRGRQRQHDRRRQDARGRARRDPRRYALVAFGGMGPMHAHAVAAGLKIGTVICPASAGVLSAWGMLVAPHGLRAGALAHGAARRGAARARRGGLRRHGGGGRAAPPRRRRAPRGHPVPAERRHALRGTDPRADGAAAGGRRGRPRGDPQASSPGSTGGCSATPTTTCRSSSSPAGWWRARRRARSPTARRGRPAASPGAASGRSTSRRPAGTSRPPSTTATAWRRAPRSTARRWSRSTSPRRSSRPGRRRGWTRS